jgi:hypothetical protein
MWGDLPTRPQSRAALTEGPRRRMCRHGPSSARVHRASALDGDFSSPLGGEPTYGLQETKYKSAQRIVFYKGSANRNTERSRVLPPLTGIMSVIFDPPSPFRSHSA